MQGPPTQPDPRHAAPQKPPEQTQRCKRCGKPVADDQREPFFPRTGLCFWCAYVDPQG